MKIVEPGSGQDGWARELKCTGHGNGGGGCGAKLLVERPDVYRTFSSHYDGSTDEYFTFTCGACGVESDIRSGPPGDVPTKAEWWQKTGRRGLTVDGEEADVAYSLCFKPHDGHRLFHDRAGGVGSDDYLCSCGAKLSFATGVVAEIMRVSSERRAKENR